MLTEVILQHRGTRVSITHPGGNRAAALRRAGKRYPHATVLQVRIHSDVRLTPADQENTSFQRLIS